jgi:hypothetical protein
MCARAVMDAQSLAEIANQIKMISTSPSPSRTDSALEWFLTARRWLKRQVVMYQNGRLSHAKAEKLSNKDLVPSSKSSPYR